MRTLAITKRVLKELLRDKQTLALMFIAPILILVLMSFIFSSNQTIDVKIGTVTVGQTLDQDLAKTKHVTVKHYATKKAAAHALKKQRVDATLRETNGNYHLTYANTDSSKTAAVKMAFKNAVTNAQTTGLKNKLVQATTALVTLKQQLPAAMQAKLPAQAAPKTQTPKVTNHYIYGNSKTGFFDKILPILIGFFVFFFVFLISGMALLRERTSGTLDRLLATPVKRSEIVFGYMLGYGVIGVLQTIVIVLASVWLLNVEVVGSLFSLVVVNLVLALVALACGILLSTFASSEFQMMQFMPIVVIPQVFFSGIIPLASMASWVRAISAVIPIKYSGDASTQIMMFGTPLSRLGFDVGILLIFLLILTVLNIVGLRRYRKA
ncbi:ABC-type multidrug transport system, permease component [Lactobacillus selangorensis]|uniref:ABC-type multidrug transport system, permease component n=1 Tax=Lactobacillus selangorensis TaxID=81857 RepID=A0A0R2FVN2_9LACO|nr:ABC transporter permease [Lactobacillus selangorensis]KRN29559.1 ABC-type multidrug transport system, permease component [Lactobacillus selangorensis]KRN33911.1 ABC-type multidrug transport system, permease component [Lactobacillus selangorensis]